METRSLESRLTDLEGDVRSLQSGICIMKEKMERLLKLKGYNFVSPAVGEKSKEKKEKPVDNPVKLNMGEEKEIGEQHLMTKLIKEGEGGQTTGNGSGDEVPSTGSLLDGNRVDSNSSLGSAKCFRVDLQGNSMIRLMLSEKMKEFKTAVSPTCVKREQRRWRNNKNRTISRKRFGTPLIQSKSRKKKMVKEKKVYEELRLKAVSAVLGSEILVQRSSTLGRTHSSSLGRHQRAHDLNGQGFVDSNTGIGDVTQVLHLSPTQPSLHLYLKMATKATEKILVGKKLTTEKSSAGKKSRSDKGRGVTIRLSRVTELARESEEIEKGGMANAVNQFEIGTIVGGESLFGIGVRKLLKIGKQIIDYVIIYINKNERVLGGAVVPKEVDALKDENQWGIVPILKEADFRILNMKIKENMAVKGSRKVISINNLVLSVSPAWKRPGSDGSFLRINEFDIKCSDETHSGLEMGVLKKPNGIVPSLKDQPMKNKTSLLENRYFVSKLAIERVVVDIVTGASDRRNKELPALMNRLGFPFLNEENNHEMQSVYRMLLDNKFGGALITSSLRTMDLKTQIAIPMEKNKGIKGVEPEVKEEEPRVTGANIHHIVYSWTGEPVEKVSIDDCDRLFKMKETLHTRISGQEDVVQASAIHGLRVGLKNANATIFSFIFLGPTGVVKCELAIELVAYYFGLVEAMTQLDISGFIGKRIQWVLVAELGIWTPVGIFRGQKERREEQSGVRFLDHTMDVVAQLETTVVAMCSEVVFEVFTFGWSLLTEAYWEDYGVQPNQILFVSLHLRDKVKVRGRVLLHPW